MFVLWFLNVAYVVNMWRPSHTSFFYCHFAIHLWNWLFILKVSIDLSYINLHGLLRSWSPQCQIVMLAVIVDLVIIIWYCCNKNTFGNKYVNCNFANNIAEFVILKYFSVNINVVYSSRIKEVTWNLPVISWIKCNTYGSGLGPEASGGIFKDTKAIDLGCYICNLIISSSFNVEHHSDILAIEMAFKRGWTSIWLLETYYFFFTLVLFH